MSFHTYINAPNSNKLKKTHDWSNSSLEFKRTQNLIEYTKELYSNIDILVKLNSQNILNTILEITQHVMFKINEYEGKKRGKIKNGIIAVCIYYACKQIGIKLTYTEISKNLGLPIKFITSGEKIILELINNNKIFLNKKFLVSNISPIDYIYDVIGKMNLLPHHKINETINIIKICQDNDILIEHSPLCLAVTCLYYICDINLKQLCEIYDISVVTVTKTYNKLIVYDKFIKNQI